MRYTRYVIAILLIFCGKQLFAQVAAPTWGGGADQKEFSFGFTFSYVDNYLKIDKNPNWRAPFADKLGLVSDSLKSISSASSPGFAVGFLARYALTEHLEVRSTPSIIFSDRLLNYTFNTSEYDRAKAIRTTVVDLPVFMKLKSDRVGNLRAYILGGLKYSQSLSQKADGDDTAAPLEKAVKNVKGYGSYEVGIGFDIYFEFFKMSPELKLSNSFGDILVHENTAFATPINKLRLHTVMFSLHFE